MTIIRVSDSTVRDKKDKHDTRYKGLVCASEMHSGTVYNSDHVRWMLYRGGLLMEAGSAQRLHY